MSELNLEVRRTVDLKKTIETMLFEYPDYLRFLKDDKAESYKAEAKYIEPEPNVHCGGLQCRLYITPGWSLKGSKNSNGSNGNGSHVTHFTATESIISHNQMAYVLLAYMGQLGELDRVKPQSLDNMNSKKFEGMVIRRYEVDFPKSISSSDGFEAELYVKKQKLTRTKEGIFLYAQNEIKFEKGKASGISKVFLRFNENEIYQG